MTAYSYLLPLARLLLRLFFRRIEAKGSHAVPTSGPVIFAANHPNMLMDALVLATSQPRKLSFLAKATLFHSPLLGRFLATVGVLPVYRRSDNHGETGKNVLTFGACFELLANGGAVAIFPEGVSHERQAVLPLKTGCSRIALECEERNDFNLGITVIPAGLYYSAPAIFRSDILVVLGPTLDPADYFEHYRSEPQEAVRKMTADLERRLRKLTLHVPHLKDEPLIEALRHMFTTAPDMGSRLAIDQTLVEAVAHFNASDPERYRRLRRDVLHYRRWLSTLDVDHSRLERRNWSSTTREMVPRFVLVCAALPFFLYGALNNFLPYKIPGWVSRGVAREPVEVATTKLVAGMLSFPLFYSLQTWAVWRWFGSGPAIIYSVLLPLTGLAALFYVEATREFFGALRLWLLHWSKGDRMHRLHEMRDEIVRELELCRSEYLAFAERT